MKSVGLIFLIAVLVMILLTAGGMLLGRWMLHPGDIPVKASLVPDEPKQRFLAFFAHPDDEIAMGGTLIGLSEAGHEIVLVYLTRGEAGPTNGLVPQSELGATRTNEIQQVGKILGLHALELFDFPDSGLKDVSMDTIKQVAREMITKHQPDILLSFDSEVGLYGHPDHRAASRALEEVYSGRKWASRIFSKTIFSTHAVSQADCHRTGNLPGLPKKLSERGEGTAASRLFRAYDPVLSDLGPYDGSPCHTAAGLQGLDAVSGRIASVCLLQGI
jgi:N-acetylglucosamine malate deacetylase 2